MFTSSHGGSTIKISLKGGSSGLRLAAFSLLFFGENKHGGKTMDAKRTSQEIDKELQAERETIKKLQRELEATKKEQTNAEAQQERLAYRALAEGERGAQKALDEAEEKLTRAGSRIRSREKAIAEGMRRFEALQREHETTYRAEQWGKTLALAAEAQKEAEEIDVHIEGLSKFLASHQTKLEQLKQLAHGLGYERAFRPCGVRHAFRVLNWRLIQSGASGEAEKPSQVYRENGYAAIFAMQVEAAKKAPETQANGQDGNGHDPEPAAAPESEAGAEAGTGA